MIAIIPVAGLGTRLLPASKAIPKEMMPIVAKPIIQWVVEEASAAGISKVVLITRYGKEAIENHFDTNFEVEQLLNSKGKLDLLLSTQKTIPHNISIVSIRQPKAKGLGDAILCGQVAIKDEPIAILLPDILMLQKQNEPLDLKLMIDRYSKTGHSQILVSEVPSELVDQYGIVNCSDVSHETMFKPITSMVEKPKPHTVKSNLSIVGRYVLSPSIFKHLSQVKPHKDNEIQLTDAINQMLQHGHTVEAIESSNSSYDCGSRIGYLKANIAAALKNPHYKEQLTAYIKDILD